MALSISNRERRVSSTDESHISDERWQAKVDALYSHPLFMTRSPDQKDVDSNEHLKALQHLLYEGSTEEIAENFKNQGNECYQAGKVKYKDALVFYTKGLDVKCPNNTLNSILYANRAAVHLELNNFRSAIEDCLNAIQLQPNLIKAHYRAACAYCAIDKMTPAVTHIDRAISLDPNNQTLENEKKNIIIKKEHLERKKHEEKDRELQKRTKQTQLVLAINKRSIRMDDDEFHYSLNQDKSLYSMSNNELEIFLDDQGYLHWPVVFLYPEYQQSDLISDFMEIDTFQVHLETMFPSERYEPVVLWDERGIYKAKYLEVYFEVADAKATCGQSQLISIKNSSTLLSSLSNPQCSVRHGLPTFIVLCSKSPFRDKFINKYII